MELLPDPHLLLRGGSRSLAAPDEEREGCRVATVLKSKQFLLLSRNRLNKQPSKVFFVSFTSFIEMHLLEGPDLGDSMIFHEGILEKKI